ncbi:hypothetical protein O9G_002157 [Rozella allomycis CSF55]|uniref:WIBG Mago-binding domain-containing protein n=1 Tax=Rozella allomycis (strain CSF55) TaxID=988480 RepID=A0A075AQ06_ROZAC|nr:hypothetical protein O9G_002157 [Rozella allomycis CSF55]|eukprot:EPZ32316.1 hypothetical protein O9G_002157 [Rozella allomycis CSF55]
MSETVQGTQRPDGTWRKSYKVRTGYVALEDRPKYVVPQRRAPKNALVNSMDKTPISQHEKHVVESNKPKYDALVDQLVVSLGGMSMEDTKRLRSLKKKLRQIEDIETKLSNGTILNNDQMAKLKSKDEVLRKINLLEAK